ncbi:hypothetical protein GCM10007043_10290 [Calditerricola satsumensis]|uniref:Uncharacterized protein n=1 Tax=Calditerricola satsumensis TaxID=373054 RepID=A0A8J3B982_9BACI|nr:hypothetical protein GCM10007043_10290 [Calditerricola satsumensis]
MRRTVPGGRVCDLARRSHQKAAEKRQKPLQVAHLFLLINPPVALYSMQGLNTTPVHGHTAL